MKKIIIPLVIVVLIGGGFLVWKFVLTNQTPSQTSTEPTTTGFPVSTTNRPIATSTNSIPDNTPYSPVTESFTIDRVARITTNPASRATSYMLGSSTIIRYVDRASGNIYDATTEPIKITRVSNLTFPKLAEVLWVKSNQGIFRYLNEAETSINSLAFTIKTTSTASSTPLTTTELASDMTDMSIAPSATKMFYITPSLAGDKAQGVVANLDGSKPSTIFNSALTEWISQWPVETTITLTTKASASAPGSMYFLNGKTGVLESVLANINGLVTLTNPTASTVLYYNATDKSLNYYNVKTKTSTQVSVTTIPEKCVWSKKNSAIVYCAVPNDTITAAMPDSWYQGTTMTRDGIWKIDTSNNTATRVQDLNLTSKGSVDAMNLSLSPDEKTLVLTNKRDLSLWEVNIYTPY